MVMVIMVILVLSQLVTLLYIPWKRIIYDGVDNHLVHLYPIKNISMRSNLLYVIVTAKVIVIPLLLHPLPPPSPLIH